MCTLAKDPSSRIANIGRRMLSIVGIEVAKPLRYTGVQAGESTTSGSAGIARSSSWLDMNGGRYKFAFCPFARKFGVTSLLVASKLICCDYSFQYITGFLVCIAFCFGRLLASNLQNSTSQSSPPKLHK